MTTIFQAIFLGIVQGAAEFLPISSSAHLVIVPWFLEFPDPGLSFDVALHLGTLVAVVWYFWRDWLEIFEITFKNKVQNANLKSQNYGRNILYFLVIASLPGAVFGYLLESYAETTFRSPLLIAFTLSLAGLALYLVDAFHSHRKNLQAMSWLDSLWIGASQALAIIPGISRSGATITAGLFLGYGREAAARFSFLLSTPIIFGAALVKIPHLATAGITPEIFWGIASSAFSGYFAIKYLLKFVARSSYKIFFWYRIAMAGLILLVYILR